MKSTIARFFSLLVMAVLLASCSMDHRQTEQIGITQSQDDHDIEWTILFYGAGNQAGDMLREGQSQTIEIVHGLQNTYTTERVHAAALISTVEDNGQCRFFDIQFHPGEEGNRISSESQDWGQQDMSSPQLLKRFVDSVTAQYPARHYALIIGGEGEAWRGACRDDANGGQMMPIPALRQSLDAAISQNGSPMHFDLILWLTPGMSTMEVAYEMRNKADFMVATSSRLPQPGFLASDQWMLDLTADPTMSAERLGRFMIARMAERAQAVRDTLATFVLLDMHFMGELARHISIMADSVRGVLQGNSSQMLQVWQSLWDTQTGDSFSVDVPAFTNAVLAHEIFSSYPGIRQTAEHAQQGFNHVFIDRRSTRQGSERRGLTIYSPMVLLEEELQVYNALRMSQDEPGWADLLSAMQESGSELVKINGRVSWAGHALQNLYVFLNTSPVGSPQIALTSPVFLTNIITPDNAEYESFFALAADSVEAYLGIFQDLDNDQQLSSGDRYGYYHQNPSPPRDWMVIYSGDEISSAHIDLSRTY
ncbi:hypothetical protein EHM69_10680 [candidate division KSB1 bacterium]|nr:MAG: hypothetical protein EHM69_10680 [candidate division KSB1 bacterium]